MSDPSPAPTGPTVRALAADLARAATATDQRRLLVLSGARDAGWDAVFDAVDGAGVDDDVTLVTTREGFRFERVSPPRADSLLGTTRRMVVCDGHEGFSPNLLGRLSGVVDGGGLLVLLTPPLDDWSDRRTDFDERLAVPPFSVETVTGRFRRRLVDVLRTHPGVAVVDVDGGTIQRDGTIDDEADLADVDRPTASVSIPDDALFPRAAYEACLTRDQARAVAALERLHGESEAVVVEADRGRGKSSAAGIAAACLARDGRDVLVTAPRYRNAREGFVRALALFETLGVAVDHDEADHVITVDSDATDDADVDGDGRIRFLRPAAATNAVDEADVVLVDEAAALPVRVLTAFLDASRVAFFTTVHGYEGAGRGFTVRFRDHLDVSSHAVTDVRLDDPIRYARGDPVESLAFRALLLDARPPVEQLVADATPDTVAYDTLTPEALLADEHTLREAFGLLVLAHYRTEPNDLARVLDAPNLTLRALVHEGHVVSVALLAREGGLDADTRARMYGGARVRGNMLPDVLTSQLRDEDAGVPVGYRVMRIATHHTVRSRGLGSRLLDEIRSELQAGDPLADRLAAESVGHEPAVDWLGVGYGATPALVSFWHENGFSTLYLSTSRNETSGEHSVVMLEALSSAGEALRDRHTRWFCDQVAGVLSDPLRDVDPDVVRASLRAVDASVPLSLTDREWRLAVDASFGPGLYSAHPSVFRRLALRALVGSRHEELLTPAQERLLVRKVLQAHPWPAVADELDYVSPSECMRSLGRAYQPIVEHEESAVAASHRRRYE
ncbi:tRNA(Met) cytidine acetyltransferase TmcA [Salinigranum salinum]|uniref:tRNA(Met) cytidine acetyltransferase TmcA n=1 Tax=Salinigranum salinum TaxID=1364937 RepID=UPI001261342D|nr:tRNA(Met) cytidine acetyltransferase TmcA [Salinigranum salinum]